MTVVLMCGLSFAGKSTLAGLIAEELGAELVGLDSINEERGLRGGDGIPLDEWAATNRIAHERATGLLRARRDVVVDDTGSPRFIRDGWRAVADEAGSAFALVWVRIDPEVQRRRVLANRRDPSRHDVVDRVPDSHVSDFEPPAEDESPLVVDAGETRDSGTVRRVVSAIRDARPGRA